MPKMPAKDEVQSPSLNLSTADLQALISAAVSAAVAESRKPYIDPVIEAAKRQGREDVRAQENQRLANMAAAQDNCAHMDGNENYAFVGQRNCLGQAIFICSQCYRPFKPTDPDYASFARFVKGDKLGNARS
jgi:hypothetical protein